MSNLVVQTNKEKLHAICNNNDFDGFRNLLCLFEKDAQFAVMHYIANEFTNFMDEFMKINSGLALEVLEYGVKKFHNI